MGAKNDLPLVSVIMPVYNVEKYVEKCLESVCGQSYEKIEIIVVDDGSTDESGALCDGWAKKDSRVKVYHKKNGGLSSARNYGIKRAKGEYICLVDSDDYVKKEFVKEMVDVAVRESADVVVCGYNDEIPKEEILTGKEATIRLLTQQENMEIIAWNKMYKRGLFDGICYPEGENYEDCLTTYKLLSRAGRVAYLAKSLYRYAERTGSITKSDKKEEKLLVREKAAREAVEYFADQKDLKQAAEIAMLTAKLAFVDFAVSGQIGRKYLGPSIDWVKKNAGRLLKNQFMTWKLRLYIRMISVWGGKIYIGFRKIRHE